MKANKKMMSQPELSHLSQKDYNKCKNALKSSIRQQFARSDHYKQFIASRRVEWTEKTISKNFKVSNRKRVSYRCEGCGELFSLPEINVDHIEPIGRGVFDKIEDAFEFFKLVYCDYSNLQILCKEVCHKNKTALENKERSFKNATF